MKRSIRPLFFPGDGTALVTLTRGKLAIIDADDASLVSAVPWYAQQGRNDCWYAAHKGAHGQLLMHRVIIAAEPGTEVDHQNGDGLFNRRSNLVVGDRVANSRNIAPRASSPLGVLGVYKHKKTGRYGARICIDYRSMHLGYFATFEEAKMARAAAEVRAIGVNPRRAEELREALGEPEGGTILARVLGQQGERDGCGQDGWIQREDGLFTRSTAVEKR